MDETQFPKHLESPPSPGIRQGHVDLTCEYSGLEHNRNFESLLLSETRCGAGVGQFNYLVASNHLHMLCPGAWKMRIARTFCLLLHRLPLCPGF